MSFFLGMSSFSSPPPPPSLDRISDLGRRKSREITDWPYEQDFQTPRVSGIWTCLVELICAIANHLHSVRMLDQMCTYVASSVYGTQPVFPSEIPWMCAHPLILYTSNNSFHSPF